MFKSTPVFVSLEAVEALRNEVGHLFEVYDTTLDVPESGHFRFRGRPLNDMGEHFDELRGRFEKYGFTPLLRQDKGYISLIGLPTVIAAPPTRWRLNLFLFLATILSTLFTGALNEPSYGAILERAAEAQRFIPEVITGIWVGWPFCLSIMLILGAHELGHYFAARYHKVPASLPYFIPMPLSIIGTMGAFILQRGPSKNVRAQFDIGASGPLAGMVFALPILIIGLATSPVGPLPSSPYILEGNSILYSLIKFAVFGEMLPSAVRDVSLNQVAWAGWTGFLVTGLNLLPVGQLDGGRVTQVLFGERFLRQIYWPILIGLVFLGFLTQTSTWFVWVALLFFFGNRYERPLDEITPLDGRRRALAIFTLVLFILVFVPIPLQTVFPG